MVTITQISEMKIGELLKSISLAFAGRYQSESNEVKEMKDEVFSNLEIPSAHSDRQNISNDSKQVVEDFRKAYQEYRKSNG